MVNRKKFVLSCVGKDFNWGIWSGESRPRCVRGKRSHEVCSLLSVISSSVVRARQWESSSGWGRKFERNRWGEIIFQIIESNGGNGIHNDELRDPNLFRRVFFSVRNSFLFSEVWVEGNDGVRCTAATRPTRVTLNWQFFNKGGGKNGTNDSDKSSRLDRNSNLLSRRNVVNASCSRTFSAERG